jgi:tetratricopeptide (TPR) repeat protein
LKGQYYRARYTPESMTKAKECYERALVIDPNYAPAFSGLAGYYYSLAVLAMKPAADVARFAKSAAGKALAIDPTNSDAHSVSAIIAGVFDYDWKTAETHHCNAMAVEPVPPLVRYRYAVYYLLPWGRFAEAMEQCRLGLETDPVSMIIDYGLAWSTCLAKQYRESIECARRALEIDPNFYLVWYVLGLAQLHAGFEQNAIDSLKRVVELAPWWHMGVGALAVAYYQVGDHSHSQEWVRKLADSYSCTVGAALYYAALGEVESVFEALEGAHRQRDLFVLYIQNLPFFDSYRAHPRFRALVERMNLA